MAAHRRLGFWAPAFNGEFTFDGMTSFEYMHVQIPYVSNKEVILPMISHFHKKLDVGFSIMEPMDAKVPAAKFQFANGEKCYNWGSMAKDIRAAPVLETVNYYIGLVGRRPMRTKIMLMFHEGDWRPGLGKVFKRWQEFFVPTSDTIYETRDLHLRERSSDLGRQFSAARTSASRRSRSRPLPGLLRLLPGGQGHLAHQLGRRRHSTRRRARN